MLSLFIYLFLLNYKCFSTNSNWSMHLIFDLYIIMLKKYMYIGLNCKFKWIKKQKNWKLKYFSNYKLLAKRWVKQMK